MIDATEIYRKALELAQNSGDPSEITHLLQTSSEQGNIEATVALAHWTLKGGKTIKNTKHAFRLMKQAADNGHAQACYNVAVSFERGMGTKENKKKAFYYYFLGYLRGDVDASFELYRCFYYGIGTDRNLEVARALHQSLKSARKFASRSR